MSRLIKSEEKLTCWRIFLQKKYPMHKIRRSAAGSKTIVKTYLIKLVSEKKRDQEKPG